MRLLSVLVAFHCVPLELWIYCFILSFFVLFFSLFFPPESLFVSFMLPLGGRTATASRTKLHWRVEMPLKLFCCLEALL